MDDKERKLYRKKFEDLCVASGYPEGVRPGTSMMNTPFRGGAVLTLPTSEDEWREDAHYATLPPEKQDAE